MFRLSAALERNRREILLVRNNYGVKGLPISIFVSVEFRPNNTLTLLPLHSVCLGAVQAPF